MKRESLIESVRAGMGQTALAMAAPAATPAIMSQELIVIIDGSITIRTVLEVNLRHAGYACLSFADGASTLRWLCYHTQQNACAPRLLLLEVELSDMDGYHLARQIRAHACWNTINLIMLNSHDRVTDRLKGQLLGVQAFLSKPFRVEQLLAVVQDTLCDSLSCQPPEQPKAVNEL